MNPFSRILVALDGSKPAHAAFDYALTLSARYGAELVAVHAVPTTERFSREARARLALSERLRRKAAQSDVALTERVQSGDPVEIILLHANSLRPDVIVMGTHQRRGLERLRHGSIAGRVAAKTAIPVLLVPQRQRAAGARPFSRVAVGVDFSASSGRAVEQALALANGSGDHVTLIHVVPGFASGVPPYLHRAGIAEYQDLMVAEGRRRLEAALPAERTGAVVHARTLVGNATSEINRIIDSIRADVLVVGRPTRGRLATALFGSTTARLIESVRIPMLAVPQPAALAIDDGRAAVPLAA